MGKHLKSISKLVVNDNEITDNQTLSNLFVEFFSEKVNNILGTYVSTTPDCLNDFSLFEGFSEIEIDTLFERLTSKKTSGMNGIRCFMKKFKATLIPFVKKLFDLLVQGNKIPNTWKIAKITPVLKKGLSLLIENYWPVSK